MNGGWAALFLLALAVAVDLWVYMDAGQRTREGRPVVVMIGSWQIASPATWLAACLVLWVFFVPLYLRARQSSDR